MVDIPTLFAAVLCLFLLFSHTTKKIIFFTWLVSLFIAVKHLCFGSDFIGLGVIFESSLFAYVLFLVTEGEPARVNKKQIIKIVFSVLTTIGLAGTLIWIIYEKTHELFASASVENTSLSELSQRILGGHFLAVEGLLLIAFLILVGLGLNLRKESKS
ncbi:MAG: hypothetical protein KA715_01920 [Xanthomonadaceae bacterium]|nr:hypothetical protein [Xanthomonadaceae bacterium]